LFVDKVVELTETAITAERKIRAEEFYFKGHYPDNPILPGVLLCESMFQAGAVLMAAVADMPNGGVPVVTRADRVKFKKMVKPGDVLVIHVIYSEKMGPAYCFKGTVTVDGKTAAACDFMCTLVNKG